ncbi:MAG: calcium/sodium antiporter [Sedimentisphaerales bacterium]|nr:calcium/sodium antiporter [Sedimentisphaerales bacterium]
MLAYVLMPVGFVLVIKGADLFVNAASALARRLGISDLVIGLTVVAFGTSLPELAVNATASVQGDAGITIGNIIGSNIANILLILGISGLVFPLAVTKGTTWKEIPLSLLAAILVGILANDRFIDQGPASVLTRIDGLVFLCFFAIFLYYSVTIARRVEGIESNLPQEATSLRRTSLLMGVGFVALIAGSKWVVDGAVKLALALGVTETAVGLTIVAVGTSLPELATSVMAAYRKNPDIAVGNVVGSNIFNIFFILGASALIRPIPFAPRTNIDIGVLLVASSLLFLWMFTGRRRMLDRWEAAVFLALYLGYLVAIAIWLK